MNESTFSVIVMAINIEKKRIETEKQKHDCGL